VLSLEAPSENLGDARGAAVVLADNYGKWRTALHPAAIRRIEGIAGKLMQEFGYEITQKAGDRDIGAGLMSIYRICDAVNLFRFRVRDEGGIAAAITQSRRAALHSGVDE
jgi:hypothetical protein